jgi:hypothetical protein
MPETLDFSGNLITILGFLGVLSTFVILITVWRSWWSSPYKR